MRRGLVLNLTTLSGCNVHRHIQNRRAKRNSGGVAVFYREELQDGITIEKNIHDTIIWLKLDKAFFHLENGSYICGVYLWCEESPVNVDLFDPLESDFMLYDAIGSVYILTSKEEMLHLSLSSHI